MATIDDEVLELLVMGARMGVEFADHWVGNHAMDCYPEAGSIRDLLLLYPGSARETAAYMRKALEPFEVIAPKYRPVAQEND